MSLHADLLRLARQLTTREPRRPRQSSLRRAISSAYYSLFHLLVYEATRRFVTGNNREALRNLLGRAFVHANMKEAAVGFSSCSPAQKLVGGLGAAVVPPELARVATAFVDLQQARHEADYDLTRSFTRQEARDLVARVEAAFGDWKAIRRILPADVFLVGLLALRQMRG